MLLGLNSKRTIVIGLVLFCGLVAVRVYVVHSGSRAETWVVRHEKLPPSVLPAANTKPTANATTTTAKSTGPDIRKDLDVTLEHVGEQIGQVARHLSATPKNEDGALPVFPYDPGMEWISGSPLDPEGNTVAVIGMKKDKLELRYTNAIYVCDRRTGSSKLLTELGANGCRVCGVSPDGKTIVITCADESGRPAGLFLVDIASPSNRKPIAGSDGCDGQCAWDRRGSLYFAAAKRGENARIYVYDGQTAKLVVSMDGGRACEPALSADEKSLYFTYVPKPDKSGHHLLAIERVDLATKNVEQVCMGESPQLTPDGKTLLFSRAPESGGRLEVCAMSLDTGQITQLTKGGGQSARLSSDGKTLFFLSTRYNESFMMYCKHVAL